MMPSRLERCPFSPSDVVLEHLGSGVTGDRCCAVAGTIVNNQHRGTILTYVGNQKANSLLLVQAGNHRRRFCSPVDHQDRFTRKLRLSLLALAYWNEYMEGCCNDNG